MRSVLLVFSVGLTLFGCGNRGEPAGAPSQSAEPSGVGVLRYTIELDAGASISAHLPRGSAPSGSGVLLLHSAVGRTPGVLAYADRLAEAGHAVYALDMFGGETANGTAEARALRDAADPAQVKSWINTAYQKLGQDPHFTARQRFVVGWSYGAAWATTVASSLSGLSGVVAIYGENLSQGESKGADIQCPLLLIGAEEDTGPAPAALNTIAAARSGASRHTRVEILPGAHGFMEPRHPNYGKTSAQRALAHVLDFVRKPTLGAAPPPKPPSAEASSSPPEALSDAGAAPRDTARPDSAPPDCAKSAECKSEGRCHWDSAWRECAPATDKDCQRSTACMKQGRCQRKPECPPSDPCSNSLEGPRCITVRSD